MSIFSTELLLLELLITFFLPVGGFLREFLLSDFWRVFLGDFDLFLDFLVDLDFLCFFFFDFSDISSFRDSISVSDFL